tara:strand:+ start:394 stop:1017 length:624 start_codon:yes stop_codon:yes gene_type:complete
MATRLNTEFNYRYVVLGDTPWARLKTIKEFLNDRKRAVKTEKIAELKYEAKKAELEYAKANNKPKHKIIELEIEILEREMNIDIEKEAIALCKKEVEVLEKLLKELYEIVEPTRLPGYSDDDMFELNSANEYTAMIAKDIQSEIIATGRPSASKIRNAMSNPYTWNALKKIGIIPEDLKVLQTNYDPSEKIELREGLPLLTNDKEFL